MPVGLNVGVRGVFWLEGECTKGAVESGAVMVVAVIWPLLPALLVNLEVETVKGLDEGDSWWSKPLSGSFSGILWFTATSWDWNRMA